MNSQSAQTRLTSASLLSLLFVLICTKNVWAQTAVELLQASAVQGGLVVVLGCDDTELLTALRSQDAYLVQGLDADPAKVEAARRTIQAKGLYGPVSVLHVDGSKLPYVDNLVNLLVVNSPCQVTQAERMRVLVPNGVLMEQTGGGWKRTVKPVPAEIDEWTHFLHGPDNNAVAKDRVVAPPHHVKWIADPKFGRNHEKSPNVNAVVSASGRLFAVVDEGPISSIALPPQWTLVAREAFNGLLLWKKPLGVWERPQLWHFSVAPPSLPRRLVAVGDRVYLTTAYGDPVAALDGATGRTLRVYEETRNACEILCTGDVLVCAVNPSINLPPKKGWADGYAETRLPGRSEIVAVRTSGQFLWRHEVSSRLWGQSLCTACGKTVYLAGNEVVCLDDRIGAVEWRHELPQVETDKSLYHVPLVGRPTVIIREKAILVARGGKELTAIDPRSGEKLWSTPCGSGFRFPPDMFVIGDDVWVGESVAWQKEPDLQRARDILTGQVTARIDASDAFIAAHHHRCYRNKATERFFLTGRRGVAFIDLAANSVASHYWVRGTCNYGVLPCNGLLYVPPDACSCYGQVRLRGFSALSPRRPLPAPTPGDDLRKGPAYELPDGAESAAEDWPTFRGDAARSGVARTAVPAKLGVHWDVQLPAPITPPVAASGRVFAAAKDSHTLYAVNSDTGQRCWQYTVGARIDSPPTFWRGRVFFGSADGCVYCLDASDGRLCWRRRLAPLDLSIVVREQLESAWPISGSLLVTADTLLGVAGRSSYLDGGLRLFRLDARSGELLWQRALYSRDPQSGAQPRTANHFHIDGFLPDILSMRDGLLFMRNRAFDLDGEPQANKTDHLYSSLGFLDDTGFHRGYWLYGHTVGEGWGGWRMMKGRATGAILSIDREAIYGYGRNKLVQPNRNVRLSFPMPDVRRELFKLSTTGEKQWAVSLPFEARALTATESVLFAAGPMGDTWQSIEAHEGRNGAELWSVSAGDGSTLHRVTLDATPIFDGMIAAAGSLYMSTVDGHIVCLGGTRDRAEP